jgi:hypothetical protein
MSIRAHLDGTAAVGSIAETKFSVTVVTPGPQSAIGFDGSHISIASRYL